MILKHNVNGQLLIPRKKKYAVNISTPQFQCHVSPLEAVNGCNISNLLKLVVC